MPWHRRSATAVIAVTVMLAVSSIGIAGPSWAHLTGHFDNIFPSANYNAGSSTCFKAYMACKADSTTHSVYTGALQPIMLDATTWSNSNLSQTDLDFVEQDPPVYTGSAETDIIFGYRDLPPGLWGQTRCDDPVNGSLCDQFYVDYDAAELCGFFGGCSWAVYQANLGYFRGLACHEAGHTLGMLHGDESTPAQNNLQFDLRCMRNPIQDDPWFGQHNREVVNATY